MVKLCATKHEPNFLYLIVSTSILSFLVSYLLDAASLAIAVKTMYHTNFNWFFVLKATAICVVTYFILLFIDYLLTKIDLCISIRWASWALTLSNIVWIFTITRNYTIISLLQQPITGSILTYLILAPIFYILKVTGKLENIIPISLDIGDAVVSAFVGLLAKTIMALIIL